MKKYLQLLILMWFGIYRGGAQNPVLWGMASSGDSLGCGTIFSYTPGTGIFRLEYSFTSGVTTGCGPVGTLIQASDHQLYGLTSTFASGNGGSIFSYNINTRVLTDLHDFYPDSTNGYQPLGSLFQASNGLLYGTTTIGGMYNSGIIFSYNIISHQFKDVYNFPIGQSGSLGYNSLIQLGDSLLYGTRVNGPGNFGVGYIYSCNIYTDTVKILYQFGTGNDGYSPEGALLQAANGLLYVMTNSGGNDYSGAICSFNPATNQENVVYSFGANLFDGYNPLGSLTSGGDSLLYGTTPASDSGSGILFSFNTHSDTETILYRFVDSLHGVSPRGSLLLASNGFLYGMTSGGGLHNAGIVFSFDTITGADTVLHSFNDTDGLYPTGGLIEVFDTFSNCTTGHSNVSLIICPGDSAYVGPYKHTQTGIYTDTITNLAGCDSIVTLNLTINPVSRVSLSDSICSGDTVYVGTHAYYSAGTYIDTLSNTGGCDSVVTLSLTIKPAPVVTLSWDSMLEAGIFQSGQYLNGDTSISVWCITYSAPVLLTGGNPPGGAYTGNGINNNILYPDSFQFDHQGPDTVVYTYVGSDGCSSRAVDSVLVGVCGAINSISSNYAISIYPNPTTDLIYIKTEGIQPQTTSIYDVSGQLLSTMRFTPQVDVSNLAPGVYLIEVSAPQGLNDSFGGVARRMFVKM